MGQRDRTPAREMKDNVQERGQRVKDRRVWAVIDEVEKQKKGREVYTLTIYLSMKHHCAVGVEGW